MDTQRRWIALDTLKLLISLVLLALILILLLQKPASVPAPATTIRQATQVVAAAPTQTPPAPANTISLPASSPTAQPSLTPIPVLPTATPPPAPTPTIAPPTSTPAAAAQPSPTTTPQLQPASVDCPLAQPSRLAVGKQALVVASLYLRKDAGMDKAVIRVSPPNSKVEIVGGPLCIPYQQGAYLWWNVKTSDGFTGWSAEASLSKNIYFLQPAP